MNPKNQWNLQLLKVLSLNCDGRCRQHQICLGRPGPPCSSLREVPSMDYSCHEDPRSPPLEEGFSHHHHGAPLFPALLG
jgi:hypothetical protein